MVCYVLLCLMLASPGTLLFLQVEYIMQSTKCFETHMVCASSCLNIWRALLVSTDKWRQLVGFYYKIPVRICLEDLEFLVGTFVLILVKFEKQEKQAGFWFLWCSSETERHHMDNITRMPKTSTKLIEYYGIDYYYVQILNSVQWY